MNKKRFRELADTIEANKQYFNQRHWCGTSCCVAGWAVWLFGTPEERKLVDTSPRINNEFAGSVAMRAEGYLDITYDQGRRLFSAYNTNHPIIAADALRDMARSGKVRMF